MGVSRHRATCLASVQHRELQSEPAYTVVSTFPTCFLWLGLRMFREVQGALRRSSVELSRVDGHMIAGTACMLNAVLANLHVTNMHARV